MLILALCLVLAEPPLSERIAKIDADFAALEKTFYAELVQAKHDDAKVSEANRVYQAKWMKAAEELKALVKAHPDDPAAVDGLIVLTGAMRHPLDKELTDLAVRERDDPRMGGLCYNLIYRGQEPWANEVVRAVAESNPSKDVKGQAIFCLGMLRRDAAFPYSDPPGEERRARLIEQARGFFKQVVETYPDVKTPDGKAKIALKADHEMKRFDNLPNLKVGGVAPEISGEDLEGRPMKLSDHKGKVVVVVFWGSWCGPCMAMVPHEKELWERHRGGPFALIGVNCGDTREEAKKSVAEKGMAWPHWYDGDETRGPIETDYDVQHWPTVYVIDAKGVIRYFDVRGPELEKAVETLLAETK